MTHSSFDTASKIERLRKIVSSSNLEVELRMIIAMARAGGSEPKETYTQLIGEAMDKHLKLSPKQREALNLNKGETYAQEETNH